MLSGQESFKVGFLSRCVEEGVSNEEALQRIKAASDSLDAAEKQAGVYDMLRDSGGFASNLLSPLVGQAASAAKNTLLFAPPVLGAGQAICTQR